MSDHYSPPGQVPPRMTQMLALLLNCQAATDLSVSGLASWCDDAVAAARAVRADGAAAHHAALGKALRDYLRLAKTLKFVRYQGTRRSGEVDITMENMTYGELLALVEDVR